MYYRWQFDSCFEEKGKLFKEPLALEKADYKIDYADVLLIV